MTTIKIEARHPPQRDQGRFRLERLRIEQEIRSRNCHPNFAEASCISTSDAWKAVENIGQEL
jgi:hypothetical protein